MHRDFQPVENTSFHLQYKNSVRTQIMVPYEFDWKLTKINFQNWLKN